MPPYRVIRPQWVKSMALEGFEWSFRLVIFKPNLMIGGWGIACEIAVRWMSLVLTDDVNIGPGNGLVLYGTKPLPSQCWVRFMSPYGTTKPQWVNTLRPRQNGCHFADDIFKYIFLNENAWILLKISLKFVRKVRINNILALVQIIAWRRPGNKPLSEPMMVSLLTYICVTRPLWVKQCNKINLLVIYLQSNSAYTRFSFWAGTGIGWLSLPKVLMIYLLPAWICIWHVPKHTQRCVLSEFSWHQIYEPFQGTTSVAPGKYCLSRTSNMCILGKQNRFCMPTKETANKSLNFWSEWLS